jgi:hypothetical protein
MSIMQSRISQKCQTVLWGKNFMPSFSTAILTWSSSIRIFPIWICEKFTLKTQFWFCLRIYSSNGVNFAWNWFIHIKVNFCRMNESLSEMHQYKWWVSFMVHLNTTSILLKLLRFRDATPNARHSIFTIVQTEQYLDSMWNWYSCISLESSITQEFRIIDRL